MPLPIDFLTNERVENILLGIAQQIEGAMTTVRSEMTGVITEAELRWQTRLAAQTEASERDRRQAPPDGLEAVRARLSESETQTSELLRAQNAELQQLQEGLRELEQQARRSTTTTAQLLEQRTDVVLLTRSSRTSRQQWRP